MDTYTGYQVCQFVNHVFGLELPPQMFYTYIRKGRTDTRGTYIQSIGIDGKRYVTRDEVIRWVTGYATRNKLTPKVTANTQTNIGSELELATF